MNLDFLDTYNDHTLGPIQQDEALFLYGLCRMVRPHVVLEIGCLIGQSLRVWLNAGVEHIYAVDAVISKEVRDLAHQGGRCVVNLFEQDMKKPIPLGLGPPDLVFIDASHVLEDNQAALSWIAPHLQPGAIVAFHDTGHWKQDHMTKDRAQFIKDFGGHWDDTLQAWVHHPGEKATIAWVSSTYNWNRLDLWTTETARYGITLFQVPSPGAVESKGVGGRLL